MTSTIILNGFAVFLSSGLWVVRDRITRMDIAHEPTKAGALKVARMTTAG